MQKAVVGLFVFGALLADAHAADIPQPRVSSRTNVSAASWDGLYAGLKLGGDLERFRWDSTPTFAGLVAGGTTIPSNLTTPFSTSLNSTNIIAGGQIGYQWQVREAVFGLEADFQRTGANTGRFVPLDPPASVTSAFDTSGPTTDLLSAKAPYSASLRTRFGLAVQERVLIYGTAGIAFANVTATGNYVARTGLGSAAATYERNAIFTGWTAGFGAEIALTDKWLLGAEYRYSDYGGRSSQLGSLTNNPSGRIWNINNSIGLTSSSTVLKLNYKL